MKKVLSMLICLMLAIGALSCLSAFAAEDKAYFGTDGSGGWLDGSEVVSGTSGEHSIKIMPSGNWQTVWGMSSNGTPWQFVNDDGGLATWRYLYYKTDGKLDKFSICFSEIGYDSSKEKPLPTEAGEHVVDIVALGGAAATVENTQFFVIAATGSGSELEYMYLSKDGDGALDAEPDDDVNPDDLPIEIVPVESEGEGDGSVPDGINKDAIAVGKPWATAANAINTDSFTDITIAPTDAGFNSIWAWEVGTAASAVIELDQDAVDSIDWIVFANAWETANKKQITPVVGKTVIDFEALAADLPAGNGWYYVEVQTKAGMTTTLSAFYLTNERAPEKDDSTESTSTESTSTESTVVNSESTTGNATTGPNIGLIIGVAIATLVVAGAAVVAVLIFVNKKEAPAEEAAEETTEE